MSARNILVIGSANIDLVTRAPRCPVPGESLIGTSFTTVTGGKGANQAVAAARLGASVTFAGCVGNDVFGQMQRESLAAEGIDLAHLKTHPTEPTGTAIIVVGDDGQNSIVVTPGANFGLPPGDIATLEPAMRAADVVLLQLEVPLQTVEAALRLARECGTLSILDAGPAQWVPEELLALADIVSPNETEAEALLSHVTLEPHAPNPPTTRYFNMGKEFVRIGVRDTVFKLGAKGSLHFSADSNYLAPPFQVKPVDTTAAGDAFTAALALRWGTESIVHTLAFANATGALATTRHGAQPSMPTLQEVLAFISAQ